MRVNACARRLYISNGICCSVQPGYKNPLAWTMQSSFDLNAHVQLHAQGFAGQSPLRRVLNLMGCCSINVPGNRAIPALYWIRRFERCGLWLWHCGSKLSSEPLEVAPLYKYTDETPNLCTAAWHRYTGVPYDQRAMRVKLGETLLMDAGQPLDFDATAASTYLRDTAAVHGTVRALTPHLCA